MSDSTTTILKNSSAKFRDEGREQKIDKVDFKMVTFSLGGKDYGIDIMKVKEIAKFGSFTYVPNSTPFVRGVYNLRGDIIPIIDLRVMFHLPVERKREGVESGLILSLEENILGVIVDSIDKVVGIAAEDVQPPHPIFGDINIKYISGVVESSGRLYIILDVEKIFGKEEPEPKKESPLDLIAPAAEEETAPVFQTISTEEPDKDFIVETLKTFRNFHVTGMNRGWMEERFRDWKGIRGRKGADLQLKSPEEADEFLENFYSPYTGKFWPGDYMKAVMDLLPEIPGKMINLWNPGCGKGHETYSLAAIMTKKYPDQRLKLWANDNDLLSISTAPNLVFSEGEIPDEYREYTVKGKNGLSFQSSVKEKILFEYHDVLNPASLPEIDIIVARDILSFLKEEDQKRILEEFYGKIKPQGVMFLGVNECPLNEYQWEAVEKFGVTMYKKVSD